MFNVELSKQVNVRYQTQLIYIKTVRAIIAERIIEAATNGERDPGRLYEQALIPFGIEDLSMLVVDVGPKPPLTA